jgi:hypothetical protein
MQLLKDYYFKFDFHILDTNNNNENVASYASAAVADGGKLDGLC